MRTNDFSNFGGLFISNLRRGVCCFCLSSVDPQRCELLFNMAEGQTQITANS